MGRFEPRTSGLPVLYATTVLLRLGYLGRFIGSFIYQMQFFFLQIFCKFLAGGVSKWQGECKKAMSYIHNRISLRLAFSCFPVIFSSFFLSISAIALQSNWLRGVCRNTILSALARGLLNINSTVVCCWFDLWRYFMVMYSSCLFVCEK